MKHKTSRLSNKIIKICDHHPIEIKTFKIQNKLQILSIIKFINKNKKI